tara:strand:- start:111 stop:1139 length:1029 start_codon:yes stop_codon:yes gene_type:complete
VKKLFLIIFLVQFNFIQSDYSQHPRAEFVVNELVNSHGFDEEQVLNVLKNANKQQSIIDRISKPAEFTISWDAYRNIFIEEKRIKNGKKFIIENFDTLEKAEKEFGVPKEIITAILGVETRYGNIQGKDRVLDSLTTLGFDYPRRAEFFRDELIKFFILTRENNLDIYSVKGSYAGAMGYGQFISSSYLAYAVDYDGDSFADLFGSKKDAIGSIANYLSIHGWNADADIVLEIEHNNVRRPYSLEGKFIPVKLEQGEDLFYKIQSGDTLSEIALMNNISLSKLMEMNDIKDKDTLIAGKKIRINKKSNNYFIGTENFVAITKYNYSHFYAMVVYNLARELGL